METFEIVVRDGAIFDSLILREYITPLLVFLLERKPETAISAIIELPLVPTQHIAACIKRANPKNVRLFNAVLSKIEKFHAVLDANQYDSVLSRTAFCR
jgi:hypothetical protein